MVSGVRVVGGVGKVKTPGAQKVTAMYFADDIILDVESALVGSASIAVIR